MEKNQILSASLLDLLFDGRNKNYGAYDLRKTYNRRINYALAGTVCVCLLFIVGSLLANGGRKEQASIVVANIELESIKKEEPKPEIPPPVKQPEPQVEMAKVTVPKIVKDEEVKPEDEVKDVTVLDEVKIGTIDRDGVKDDVVAPPVETKSTGAIAPKMDDEVDHVYTIVQIPAEFNGGAKAWQKYLERSLNSQLPADNGAPPASYTVVLSFIVDRNGMLSDVKAENDPGYGTKDEAIRVILKSPKWNPAIQNGRQVIYRHKQSITFKVSGE